MGFIVSLVISENNFKSVIVEIYVGLFFAISYCYTGRFLYIPKKAVEDESVIPYHSCSEPLDSFTLEM